ncbi:putative B6 ABC transporter permease subunit 2 [Chachezhania antarctica]|uniref:putative B6 ABC transporter permease subunit 2 n=1 Tax=Chachezhania antarctica TaxID=2340860 RepID=UPI000EAEB395|nr:ABC transporter permease [Chachezhania antarctica]|tara:strand:- start:1532 stop:2617 length:1086 start_codon:yes stop_codon:yes gene_type:complete
MSASSELDDAAPAQSPRRSSRWLQRFVLVTLGPILAALVVSGIVLLLFGVDPLEYYGYVVRRGLLSSLGLQQTATRMAPLLFLAAGLIVAFRAGLWNLGVDGQFLLGAVAAAALAPSLVDILPGWAMLVAGFCVAALVGALWSVVPALLRAYQGVNEIITTLMMTFLGVSLANVLVKLVFLDPTTTVPQTRTLPVPDRMPRLFDTTISSGMIWGILAVLAVHLMMTRTAFGLRLRTVGANPHAAAHAGLNVPLLTVAVFAISAGFAGLAGASEVLGVTGNIQADWNPAYGLMVIPLVFLARFHGVGSIILIFLYSTLLIGAESAARRVGVPQDFTLVLVSSLLILLALAEWLDARRSWTES